MMNQESGFSGEEQAMSGETRSGPATECTCPLCAFWTTYKNSEAAAHMRNIQRESLLLARCMLDTAIHCAEGHLSSVKTKLDPKG